MLMTRPTLAVCFAIAGAAVGTLAAPIGLSGGTQTAGPQVAPPNAQAATDALLNRLPAEWRDRARPVVTFSAAQLIQLPRASDDALRQAVARLLVRRPEADEFLKAQLRLDPSPAVRTAIAQAIGGDARWLAIADTASALQQAVATDPDAGVSIAALEALRRWRMTGLNRLLAARIVTARDNGKPGDLQRLAAEQERWISLERGVMLPAFLRTPPPVFAVAPAGRTVRVLAFGDFGTGSAAQKTLAGTMLEYHRSRPFDFGLTLGDNFYSYGMESPADPRWKTWWEDLYGPLRIPFYASLGNHDWGQSDSPAAEILYSPRSAIWRMPAEYYTFTAGPVQFFAIDTNNIAISERQLAWLDAALGASTARWKIVYGHHPIYTGGNYTDSPTLIARLLPILANRADVYLCGHDHNLQALRAERGVRFFVIGGGGAGLYALKPYDRTIFASSTNGFGAIEADAARLTIRLVDSTGKVVYEDTLKKTP